MDRLRDRLHLRFDELRDRYGIGSATIRPRRLARLAALPPAEMCAALNRTLSLRGRHPATFRHLPDARLFACDDGGRTHHFSHPAQARRYLDGLAACAARLRRDYHLDAVPLRDGDRIVEAGANVGDLLLALETVGKALSVTCFEPAPAEFAALERNLAARTGLSASEARREGLWHTTAPTVPFHLKCATGDSSFLAVDTPEATIEVPTVRLDEALPRQPYRLLKLEAEGAEPEVLRGATGIIHCFDYVSVDVSFERGPFRDSPEPQVTDFLERHGFELVARGTGRLILLFRNLRAA